MSTDEVVRFSCDFKAKRKGNLLTHMKSRHEDIKFPCGLCHYDYMSVSLLDMSPIGDIYFIWCFDPYDMGPL